MPNRSASATPRAQLDLFAELEAEQHQARMDQAPTIFDLDQRGYFTRIAEFEQWQQAHDNFDSCRRSHGWHATLFGRTPEPTATCRPAILAAELRCDHYNDDCECVGDLLYRAACLHCTWEGPAHDCENLAAEDAHDHAWPGWRTLPIVPRRPQPGNSAKEKDAMSTWARRVDTLYPAGWLQEGGPIRTRRQRYGTRHVPDGTGGGGYDMCGEQDD